MEDKIENNSKKTNNNKYTTKKAIGIALIISLILSIILSIIIFIIVSNPKPYSSSYNYTVEITGQFTGYFGEKVSPSDVKALISLIRSNNIRSQTAEETKAIGIRFKGGSISTLTITDPTAASRQIKSGKTYWVGVSNDDTSNEDPTGKTSTNNVTNTISNTVENSIANTVLNTVINSNTITNTISSSKKSDGMEAYYPLGYLRIITIIENS